MSNKPLYILLAFVILVGVYTVAKDFYMQPGHTAGEKAPDFIGATPSGKVFKLSDLRGQIILLDFWGSWCGPCIRESAELVKLDADYGQASFKDAKGFVIVSVAIEKDREKWERAIDRLGITWPYHVIDPVTSFRFFDSPVAKLYGVKEVPTKFLIDENGIIIEVNPTFEQIRTYLDQRRQAQ